MSLFDIFWDLGANDMALAMLDHRGLLLDDPEQRAGLVQTLGEEIIRAGGRTAYVAEQLEAIEEVYQDYLRGGARNLPALATPARKMLPAAGRTDQSTTALATYASRVPGGVEDRDAWRTGARSGPLRTGDAADIDIDAAVGHDIKRLLASLLDGGSIVEEAKRWFAMREARKLRDALDLTLTELHAVYVAHGRDDPQTRVNLLDNARRWEAEVNRVGALKAEATYAGESRALCADVLLDEAKTLATNLARAALTNVEETIGKIDEHAAKSETAMAGYLVYVNRYAFFAGRMAVCEQSVREVEAALSELAIELQRLQRQGVL
ncbi:MAG: hypothetical protein AB1Z98_14100 [Nannocystaceae bacterium]